MRTLRNSPQTRFATGAALFGVTLALGIGANPAAGASSAHVARDGNHGYTQVNLVSDVPGLAKVTDAHVVNPWGISFGPQTPLWVANNGTATSTIYAGANGSGPISTVPLVVDVPEGVTGTVFNDTSRFHVPGTHGTPALFLFDSLGGDIAAWTSTDPVSTAATTVKHVPGAVFTGLTLARSGDGARLYAADAAGGVRVYNGNFHQVDVFRDHHLQGLGLSPYGIQAIGHWIYVTYAPAPGVTAKFDGAVDVFSPSGRLHRRLITGGKLDDPWGLALAPEHWGKFGGDLLVGNEEDGRINAYNPHSGDWQGVLSDGKGHPLVNDGLWGIAFGNGVIGTPRKLIFAAGIDEYAHGLVGTIQPAD